MASSSSSSSDPTSPNVVYNGKRTSGGKRTDVSSVRAGDYLSCTQTYRVTSVGNGKVSMVTLSGGSHSTVDNGLVEEEYDSLQTNEEVKVNATQLGQIAANARGSIVEFTFFKKPTDKRAAELLDGADLSTPAKRRKIAKEILRGDKRVIKCNVTGVDEVRGRAEVIDLEIEGPNNRRQVDLRTVERCVFRGRATHL
jgi:hypothetical protein